MPKYISSGTKPLAAPRAPDPQLALAQALHAVGVSIGASKDDMARALAELARQNEQLLRALAESQASLRDIASAAGGHAHDRSLVFEHERDGNGKITRSLVKMKS